MCPCWCHCSNHCRRCGMHAPGATTLPVHVASRPSLFPQEQGGTDCYLLLQGDWSRFNPVVIDWLILSASSLLIYLVCVCGGGSIKRFGDVLIYFLCSHIHFIETLSNIFVLTFNHRVSWNRERLLVTQLPLFWGRPACRLQFAGGEPDKSHTYRKYRWYVLCFFPSRPSRHSLETQKNNTCVPQ